MSARRRSGLSLLEVVIAAVILASVCFMVYLILFSASDQVSSESGNQVLEERARLILDELAKELRLASGPTIVGSEELPATDALYAVGLESLGYGPPFRAYDVAVKRYGKLAFRRMSMATQDAAYDYEKKLLLFPVEIEYQVLVEPTPPGLPAGKFPETREGAAGDLAGIDEDGDGLMDESEIHKRELGVGPTPTVPIATKVATNIRCLAFEVSTDSPRRVTILLELQRKDPKSGKPLVRRAETTVVVRN